MRNIPIIYEDDNFLAVNKPAGLMVHPDDRSDEPTLADWILEEYPQLENVGEQLVLSSGRRIKRPGIVHRLDKETSGILLVAKNQKTFSFFKKQFQEHKIKKTYQALVYGELKKNEGIIDKPIARSRKDFRLRSASKGIRGRQREAVTEYRVLVKNDQYSFVEVFPKTGRTHQIRVHFKAINHPIVCDTLYAPKQECIKELGRLALHASSVEFKTLEGATLRLEAPLAEDIRKVVSNLFPELSIT